MMRIRTAAMLALLMGAPRFATGVDALAVIGRNCVECHNAHDKKGGVVLDRAPVVVDDLPLVLKMVSGAAPKMPFTWPVLTNSSRLR